MKVKIMEELYNFNSLGSKFEEIDSGLLPTKAPS